MKTSFTINSNGNRYSSESVKINTKDNYKIQNNKYTIKGDEDT